MTHSVPATRPASRGVWLLTGEIHIGKSTVCQSVVAEARRRGWRVAGLMSPTVFGAEGQRIAVQMIDLSTNEKRTLAMLNHDLGGPHVGPYHFDPCTLVWGHNVVAEAIARGCDLLVIDEIGRLELEQDAGLAIVPLLAACPLPLSLLVVRRPLLHLFHQKLPRLESAQFEITLENRTRAPARLARLLGLS